jgi:hypothetical protein
MIFPTPERIEVGFLRHSNTFDFFSKPGSIFLFFGYYFSFTILFPKYLHKKVGFLLSVGWIIKYLFYDWLPCPESSLGVLVLGPPEFFFVCHITVLFSHQIEFVYL